jgi:uncharacterized surface protein with fasciclin (FAS1) repeats
MKYYPIFLFAAVIVFEGCNQSNKPTNPAEIVTRDTDTVFNDIPGEQHLGKEAYNINIIDLLENVRKTYTFVEAIGDYNLRDTLQTSGPFTVIALSDMAYNDYKSSDTGSESDALVASEEFIKSLIIKGKIDIAALADGPVTSENLNGEKVVLSIVNGDLKINDRVYVTSEEFPAANGVVFEIDDWVE